MTVGNKTALFEEVNKLFEVKFFLLSLVHRIDREKKGK